MSRDVTKDAIHALLARRSLGPIIEDDLADLFYVLWEAGYVVVLRDEAIAAGLVEPAKDV
jgi:hypothetical protein